jgi:hypothetical protein
MLGRGGLFGAPVMVVENSIPCRVTEEWDVDFHAVTTLDERIGNDAKIPVGMTAVRTGIMENSKRLASHSSAMPNRTFAKAVPNRQCPTWDWITPDKPHLHLWKRLLWIEFQRVSLPYIIFFAVLATRLNANKTIAPQFAEELDSEGPSDGEGERTRPVSSGRQTHRFKPYHARPGGSGSAIPPGQPFGSNQPSNNSDEEGQGEGDNGSLPKAGVSKQPGGNYLACPFYKANPFLYPHCGTRNRIRSTHYVRQHLTRSHRQVFYCPTCKSKDFSNPHERDEHIRARSCDLSNQPNPDGVSSESFEALKEIPRSLPEPERWFRMWDILFPGMPRPESPYVEENEYAEIIATVSDHFLQNNGHAGLAPSFGSLNWINMDQRPDFVVFLRMLFSRLGEYCIEHSAPPRPGRPRTAHAPSQSQPTSLLALPENASNSLENSGTTVSSPRQRRFRGPQSSFAPGPSQSDQATGRQQSDSTSGIVDSQALHMMGGALGAIGSLGLFGQTQYHDGFSTFGHGTPDSLPYHLMNHPHGSQFLPDPYDVSGDFRGLPLLPIISFPQQTFPFPLLSHQASSDSRLNTFGEAQHLGELEEQEKDESEEAEESQPPC